MPDADPLQQPDIADYGIIGDARSAALVSRRGSIDWLCWPQFDSPSFLNRLLDARRGGYFAITPVGSCTARRAYQPATAVLVTEFSTGSGRVRVTDLMPALSESDKRRRPLPFRSLLRLVDGLEGQVDLSVTLRSRPADGRATPAFRRRGESGYCAEMGHGLLQLATPVPLHAGAGTVEGRCSVRAGQRRVFWLAYAEDAPAVYPDLSQAASILEATRRFWTGWTEACAYDGPSREAVLRSVVTLKLLSFAPSGAIVAAPTTSLPEWIGGGRNWDYRYCWLRDASYAARLFFKLGFPREAWAFVQWLLHATTLTHPALQVVYDVYGEAVLPEGHHPHLAGYRRSRPVRTGNQAHGQYQLDVYGEVLDGVLAAVEAGYDLDREMRRWIVKMADLVSAQWPSPDHGIWEIRGARRDYVHSKVLCWVALDRAERLARKLGLQGNWAAWSRAKDEIRHTVMTRGYSAACRSFVQTLDGADLDAAAVTFAPTGFVEPDDPRVLSTIARVRDKLGRGPLVYRYRSPDGLEGEEGAFLACSFWLAEALALAGQRQEAERLFEQGQTFANDLGLFSEEVNPADGTLLGNFPQALTHLAQVSAALHLSHSR